MIAEKILHVNQLQISIQLKDEVYPIVEDLSFALTKGKTLAIVGESGSGKTLTALSIMRLLPSPPMLPAQGEILYKGQNLLQLSEREMRKIRGGKIAMIFQDPASSLNPVYRVGNQLLESVALHRGLYEEEARACVIRALQEVNVPHPEERLQDYPHQLSGGLKQRIMIAMALIGEPDILIADEPTTALDATIQLQVLELMRHLQKKNNMAVLLITHDLGVVAELADDVVVMYAGMEMESGTVDQIFDQKSHPYTQGLFASLPTKGEEKGELKAIKGSIPSFTLYPTGCRFYPRCPYVMERCKHGRIPNFTIDEAPYHRARCVLYDRQ